jgi:hypothetical protein
MSEAPQHCSPLLFLKASAAGFNSLALQTANLSMGTGATISTPANEYEGKKLAADLLVEETCTNAALEYSVARPDLFAHLCSPAATENPRNACEDGASRFGWADAPAAHAHSTGFADKPLAVLI